MGAPSGWFYDPPEPMVNYAGALYHEDCPYPDPDMPTEPIVRKYSGGTSYACFACEEEWLEEVDTP